MKPTKTFIRTLWGTPQKAQRRSKINNDFKLVLDNPNEPDFKVYTFGKNNHQQLVDLGFNSELVSSKPFILGQERNGKKVHQYGHKLVAIREALKDYDEVVLLDWDCVAALPVPTYFWDTMRKKEAVQAILRGYMRTKCDWRDKERRKRACASFVYMRDCKLASKMVKYWKAHPHFAEEAIISRFTDDIVGGWQGRDKYWQLFEPDFFALATNEVPFQPYTYEQLKTKERCFLHVNKLLRYSIFREVKKKKANGVKESKALADTLEHHLFSLFGRYEKEQFIHPNPKKRKKR